MSQTAPLRYHPEVEQISADEEAVHRELAQTFESIITKTHDDLGHAERGVHAKSHALLVGEVVVHENLPPELAQGIFAESKRRYPALVRISSIPGDPLRDSVSLPRGFSLKVIGVDGARLPGSEQDTSQDFLAATAPAFSAPDSKAFLKNLKLLVRTTDKAEGAKAALSAVLRTVEKGLEAVGVESAKLKSLGGYPKTHPLGERYYTQVALRHGDYIAKLDIVPESENFRRLIGQEIDFEGRENALREEIARMLSEEGGSWTLRVQLCRDLESNPVEDASKVWPEDDNPYLPVASVIVAPQQSWSDARSRLLDDQTSFRPWHGTEAHRPLGNVMRARRYVYPISVDLRSKLNGCPMHEPRSLPSVDGRDRGE